MTATRWLDDLNQRYQLAMQRLPARDRRALQALVFFLSLALLGSLLWWAYQYHQKMRNRAQQAQATLVWMQAQAPHLRTSVTAPVPMNQLVQSLGMSQGLTISFNENAGRAQISTSHISYAVLAAFLSRLAEQGIQIETLSMQQQTGGLIQLQATLLQPV